jgi:dipeptidyl aminopeptidase/acylaminoacyl peptidase
MANRHVTPYGSWKSPITSDLLVSETADLDQIAVDGHDLYWTEMRPSEGGRVAIVRRRADGQVENMLPPPWNARSRVHEYGGGAFTVMAGVIFFVEATDQRVYRVDSAGVEGATPHAITPPGAMRYADLTIDTRRGVLIAVGEDHGGGEKEPENVIVSVDIEGARPAKVLVSGRDFFAAPRVSPDGSRLSWLAWDHPDMPWDSTEVVVAEIDSEGVLGPPERVAGGNGESIFQPEWSPDGVLYFVSDRTGYWNLYRLREGHIEPLCESRAEFGLPAWVFGLSTYAFESSQRLICTFGEAGVWSLALVDMDTLEFTIFRTPYTDISRVRAAPGRVFFRGGSPSEPLSIVELDIVAGGTRVHRCSARLPSDASYLSIAEPISFPSEDGWTAHAFFYAPRNPDHEAPPGDRPPLIVRSHGGPTGAATGTLNVAIQFWTSRGFAVVDVNYRGSTGYGRPYRDSLKGLWGVADVDDCVNAARYLAASGRADGSRLAITGGSAGGYTTLCALTFHDLFRVGASYYGIGDLEALEQETHKFESRYLHSLIGPYPEQRDLYRERSPIYSMHRLHCPVIFFQGLKDRVVPPGQAEAMVAALKEKGLPVAYLAFEEESHGFRRAANKKRAIDAELYFYARIFGFPLADEVQEVTIENPEGLPAAP